MPPAPSGPTTSYGPILEPASRATVGRRIALRTRRSQGVLRRNPAVPATDQLERINGRVPGASLLHGAPHSGSMFSTDIRGESLKVTDEV